MKAKKALKRLNKVEALLSNVIDQFPASKQELGELLDSAKAAVIRARETINSQLSTSPARRTTARAEITQQPHVTANSKQTAPLAAARRRGGTKRKSMNAPTGRRLKKTA
jgi:hypothetical protein